MVASAILFICAEVFFILLMFKNGNTVTNKIKINNAILKYHTDCILHNLEPMVDYEDAESYEATLFRIWDWGYKRILPKEKYEIIESYIK